MLEDSERGDFLRLEVVRIVEDLAVAVSEDVRGVPSRNAELPNLNAGASTVLMNVWPVLKSLPQIGAPICFPNSRSAGMVTVRFGAPLMNGMPSSNAAHA
jgi:hypothetical protein